jgi:hypothetical protein
VEPDEELRRAQELLRVLQRRAVAMPPEDVARGAGLHLGAVRAAVRGALPQRRTVLPADGSVPTGPGVAARELARYLVPASEVVRAELRTTAEQVWVRETVVERDGRPLQFRTSTSTCPAVPPAGTRLARPVDVEAVRAHEDTARALGVSTGSVVLLQVLLTVAAGGFHCLEFAYSRADAVRVLHP